MTHQYKPEQQKSPDSLMLGAHDSEMTFELLHHILAVEKEQDLLLPEAIPLQIAQKLRARALHLKTSLCKPKKIFAAIYHRFFKETPSALSHHVANQSGGRKSHSPCPGALCKYTK